MGLEIGCVDHDGLRLGFLGRKAFHHLSEHAHFVPPFPAILQCLVRPVLSGSIPPAQAVPVDEDDPAQDPPIVNPGLAVAHGEIWRKARHLLVRQPKQVAHTQSPRGARITSTSANQLVLSLTPCPENRHHLSREARRGLGF